jgi:hypothetical protein
MPSRWLSAPVVDRPYPGIADHEPNLSTGRKHAGAIENAMTEMRPTVPPRAPPTFRRAIVSTATSEGPKYARPLAVKDNDDPDGLFVVHHGVRSERWSANGFTRPS